MALPEALTHAAASWAGIYADHRSVSVAVRALHLGALLVGGGTALAADRRLLAARRLAEAQREALLQEVAASHRVVVPALALVATTGLLMTAADASTFLASPLYWSKMGLVALLLVNGGVLVFAETRARAGGGWNVLRAVSAASIALWLTILYFGVWLTAAA